ncbi:hypothetical protein AVEN_25131-1, partial [Araneus ventricosus]
PGPPCINDFLLKTQRTSGITLIPPTRCAISGRDLQSVDFIKYPWHSRRRYHLFQATRPDIRLDKASGAETPVFGRQMLGRNGKHPFTCRSRNKMGGKNNNNNNKKGRNPRCHSGC